MITDFITHLSPVTYPQRFLLSVSAVCLKESYLLSFIHSFIHSSVSVWAYGIQFYSLGYDLLPSCFVLMLKWSRLGQWEPFWDGCVLWHVSNPLWALPPFLAQDALSWPMLSLLQLWKEAWVPFDGEQCLETKIWMWAVLAATSDLASGQSKHIYVYLCLQLSLYFENHELTPVPPIPVQHHRSQ